MTCYRPQNAYRGEVNDNGKRPVIFTPTKDTKYSEWLQIPCGKCEGCLSERARQWAVRCMHEKQQHDESAFITLTYNEQNLPPNGSLYLKDLQNFNRRLKKKYENKKIRYLQCGEYGENFSRPHYHSLIFGHAFLDLQDVNISSSVPREINNMGNVKRSMVLDDIWQKGHTYVGDVTFASASYVAQYLVKKKFGKKALEHYLNVDKETGEIDPRIPEFITMSRRPGIGSEYYKKYKDEVYANDSIVINGMEIKPPKYYDRLYEKDNKEHMLQIKERRIQNALEKGDNDPDRLKVREKVAVARRKIYAERKIEI